MENGAVVAESHNFQLERFYFGILVDRTKRKSSPPGVIARTPNITPEHVKECVRLARLVPPNRREITEEMPGALGLFRSESNTFILAKAQPSDAGYPQVLYILLPMEAQRRIGGNVMSFWSLAMMDMPSFTARKQDLARYELHHLAPPTPDEQSEALLDLLLYCHDSFKNVEGLLASLVQGWPIAVINSPPVLEKRLRFVQGLLSLLPLPARVGITFATHTEDPSALMAQIKFTSQPAQPANHLIYDWQAGRLLTPPPDDSYSRYILSQLRLDPSFVIEQTAQLSRTAVWRAAHKENLGEALKWVSHRAALDQTVRQGQPADRDVVAAILREDPTLTDDLRQAYARHLLAFALALSEPEAADVIPVVAVTHETIARAIVEQLTTAIQSGRASIVYTMLERWLLNIPEATALKLHKLLHHAAKFRLQELLAHKHTEQAAVFVAHIHAAHPSLQLQEAAADLIDVAQEAAYTDAHLARALFLLAIAALPAGELHRLLADTRFVQQLPPPTQTALQYLQPENRHPAPPHVLDQGARVFGEGQWMLVLTRLVEWAMFLQRTELIDTAALHALLVVAQSPQAEKYDLLIQHVVEDFSQISIIQVLDPPGPRILVQLMLQIGQYDEAIALLEFYHTTVFGLEKLADFTKLAGEVFLMTPLDGEELAEALEYLEGSQIRPEPRAMIFCSALINRQWHRNQEYAARRLTSILFGDHHLITVIGHDNALKLLQFHARSQNALDAVRVGTALIDQTFTMGRQGVVLISRMWPLLNWDEEVSQAALELLRRYVRGVPLDEVPTLLAFLKDEIGAKFADMLQATYVMRQAMRAMNLLDFAEAVHIAAQLFIDVAATFHGDKDLPPNHRLRRELDTMTGGLSSGERRQVAQNVLNIIRQVYELGQARTQQRREPVEEQLVQGGLSPASGVDLMRFIGGHFAEQQVIPLALEREAMAHMFGSRSAAMFLRETTTITQLLDGMQDAFKDAPPVKPPALEAELQSLWGSLSLYNQRRIQKQFAQDCQHLADVIAIMTDRVNDRLLADRGIGRQLEIGQRQPQTALEALRWIYGYFARKHTH
jgi:tetratricopeptide (TPR) repeat protein